MPRLVRIAVDLQPPTAEAVRNFAEASGRPVNDVMVAALDVGLGRVMGEFNRQKREAAKVAVRVHNARVAAEEKARAEARAEAQRKAALARLTAAIPGAAHPWSDDDGGPL
jgi:hypothetical protein